MSEENPPPAVATNKKEKKKGQPPPNIQPKPKLTKAERRALQEQQRAAKAARQQNNSNNNNQQQQKPQQQQQQQQQQKSSDPKKTAIAAATTTDTSNKNIESTTSGPTTATTVDTVPATTNNIPSLVSHLKLYPHVSTIFDTGATLRHINHSNNNNNNILHPAVIELGYKYCNGTIRGSNTRCRAMLQCYQIILNDFNPTNILNERKDKDLRNIIDPYILKPAFQFWTEECRMHSVTMGNAFTFLKSIVANTLERDWDYNKCNETLQDCITSYIHERIIYANKAIAKIACTKLLHTTNHEVILTFGYSEAVYSVLHMYSTTSQNNTNPFRVIIVDSKPLYEGRIMLQKLKQLHNIVECTYVPISAVTYVMKDVTKVLLGAASLLSDGSIIGRIGSAMVAMIASNINNKPILICAETYKISNRVQLESITTNEILNNTTTNADTENKGVKKLHLLYDLIPASFISGIITEFGIVPPSSVAVLLREMNPTNEIINTSSNKSTSSTTSQQTLINVR